jgi:hypothetical protein
MIFWFWFWKKYLSNLTVLSLSRSPFLVMFCHLDRISDGLPSLAFAVGAGALKNRENPRKLGTDTEHELLRPATDWYGAGVVVVAGFFFAFSLRFTFVLFWNVDFEHMKLEFA